MTDQNGAHSGRFLWRLGDPWRDLLPDIQGADGPVAIRTGGAVRILDLARGVQCRRPQADLSADLVGDNRWLTLTSIECATPCGILTWGDGPESWSASTRFILVATLGSNGDMPEYRGARDLTLADIEATDDTHPDEPCPAYRCIRKQLPIPPDFPAV